MLKLVKNTGSKIKSAISTAFNKVMVYANVGSAMMCACILAAIANLLLAHYMMAFLWVLLVPVCSAVAIKEHFSIMGRLDGMASGFLASMVAATRAAE